MLCPRCKNPVADATKCEWCGLIIADIESQKKQIYDLDAELISLLKQNRKSQAYELCKQRTGASASYCHNYVTRLNFFLQHKEATENSWRKYIKKQNREWFWCRLVSWSLLPFVLFFTIGGIVVIFSDDSTDIAKSGCVILLIFSLIIAFPLIYWMYKTKKKLK